MDGVPVDGEAGRAGPIAFTARSETEYSEPLVRLVRVQVPATPTQGHHVVPPSTDTS